MKKRRTLILIATLFLLLFFLIVSANATTQVSYNLTDTDTNEYWRDFYCPRGQQFIANTTTINKLEYRLSKAGSPTGSLVFHLVNESGSNTMGDTIKSNLSSIDVSTLTTSYDWYVFDINIDNLVVGEKYWIKTNGSCSGWDGTAHPMLSSNSAAQSPALYDTYDGTTYRDTYNHNMRLYYVPSSDSTPPNILQNTYNMTSDGGCTAWRTNTSEPCNTTDSTPTVKFDTDENANCRIGVTDSNYTALGSGRNCGTTGTTSHICTLTAGDAFTTEGINNIYIGCQDTAGNENATSTSGALALNYTDPATGNCTIPDSGEFRMTQNCNYDTNQHKPNTKISIVGGYNLTITNNAIMTVDAIYVEDGSLLYVEDGSKLYTE